MDGNSVQARLRPEEASPAWVDGNARGLDADAKYRIEPLRIPYETWGAARIQPSWLADGVVLTGRQLAAHGVQPPTLHPESALLFKLTRV